MRLIKLPFKLIALPVVAIITLIQWIGIFLIGFSSIFFNLFAGICFVVAVLGYFMKISTGAESVKILIMSFVVFIIPYVGEWIIERIMDINYGLRDFIKN